MNLEEIKKRRLMELQGQFNEQLAEEQQLEQQIEQLEGIVKSVMTKEALQRYGNVKTAFPEKAIQLLVVLAQLIQAGRVNKIDDNYLKEILKKLTPEKKEFNIRRK